MAVAHTSDTDKTPATGSSFTYTSFAVSGTNPVILVWIGLDSTTATVSSVAVSAGLTAGTPVEVKTQRFNASYSSIWAIPAPSGTGTITVTLSASVPWQSNAELMSGADQTTPCPGADSVSAGAETTSQSLTPANLTANDASYMGAASTVAGNPTGITGGTATYTNGTTSVNAQTGYRLGTGALVANWDDSSDQASVAVRVMAAAGGGGRTTKNTRSAPLGTDVGMGWQMRGGRPGEAYARTRSHIYVPSRYAA